MSSWRLDKARLDFAMQFGEEVVQTSGIGDPPADPLLILKAEGKYIKAFGDDFGDAFDGRLEYHEPRYFLFYNTKYNDWPHIGSQHPKVRFTIAHELGHYFLDDHRAYLNKGGKPHFCLTEFTSDNLVEREADAFASGMLMPSFMLCKLVNKAEPSLESIKTTRKSFDVSLTSMMIRWSQLCDFPCATLAIKNKCIEWGFASEGFKRAGAYKILRKNIVSEDAIKFVDADPSFQEYREGSGWGIAEYWLDIPKTNVDVHEDYVVIPSTRILLVFLTASEGELFHD